MGLVQSDQTRTITIESETHPGPSILISEDAQKRIYENFVQGDRSNSPSLQTKLPNDASYATSGGDETTFACNESQYNSLKRQDLADQQDQYWVNNYKNMQQLLNKTTPIMENEFHSSYAEVQNIFGRRRSSLSEPPCQDLKAQLLQCYSENPGQSLRCVREVTAFTDCVNKSRVKQLDRKDDPSDPSR